MPWEKLNSLKQFSVVFVGRKIELAFNPSLFKIFEPLWNKGEAPSVERDIGIGLSVLPSYGGVPCWPCGVKLCCSFCFVCFGQIFEPCVLWSCSCWYCYKAQALLCGILTKKEQI